jgi:hypothetical protein
MKKPLLTVLTALAAAAALPAAALADNTLTIVQGDAVFRSEDAGVGNKFVVEDATGANAGKVRFYEPADPFGINYPPACNPGETHQGPNNSVATVEVFCPKNLVNRSITIETGPSEDSARYSVADVAGILAGDTGTDVLVADRNTNDFLSGDQGNDDIDAGGGNDEVRGEEGNDVLKARPTRSTAARAPTRSWPTPSTTSPTARTPTVSSSPRPPTSRPPTTRPGPSCRPAARPASGSPAGAASSASPPPRARRA